MEKSQALHLLKSALTEVADSRGFAKVDDYSGLREVDAKVREVRIILEGVDGLPASLLESMSNDLDFQANSRRVRLEALAGYIKSALKFVDTGAFQKPKKQIHAPPIFQSNRLNSGAQRGDRPTVARGSEMRARCSIHFGNYSHGEHLEGLLLARAQLSVSVAYRSPHAPKGKDGKPIAIQNWTLSTLIEVAADVGWIRRTWQVQSRATGIEERGAPVAGRNESSELRRFNVQDLLKCSHASVADLIASL